MDAISALAALAQETRLAAFRLLVQAGPEGLAAGAIADGLGVPAATLSFHLKELKNARVVWCRREGRSLLYGPDFGVMNDLLGFLMEDCCRGACAPPARRRRR
jgi:ArsR family transcriptional regulator